MTLRGSFDRLLLSPIIDAAELESENQRAFDAANRAYYEAVEWALDIAEARFAAVTIRGIPARLIRRDPETQGVITARRLASTDWQWLDFDGTHWRTTIQNMLDRGEEDTVLIAPKRATDFTRFVEMLHVLRDKGVAEPD